MCKPNAFLHCSFLHPSAGETNQNSEKNAPTSVTGGGCGSLGSMVRLFCGICSAMNSGSTSLQLVKSPSPFVQLPLTYLGELCMEHVILCGFLSRKGGKWINFIWDHMMITGDY